MNDIYGDPSVFADMFTRHDGTKVRVSNGVRFVGRHAHNGDGVVDLVTGDLIAPAPSLTVALCAAARGNVHLLLHNASYTDACVEVTNAVARFTPIGETP